MSDREMLERSARAYGVVLNQYPDETFLRADHGPQGRSWNPKWNPLESDGDALRLAAKLGLNVRFEDPAAVSAGWAQGVSGAPTRDGLGPWFWKEWRRDHADIMSTARRAIVTAAAEGCA